jgi:hypothetical protein
MVTMVLDDALNAVMQLSEEQQTMLLEIVQQRQIEVWRKKVAQQATESIKAFHESKLQAHSFEKTLEILHHSLEDVE